MSGRLLLLRRPAAVLALLLAPSLALAAAPVHKSFETGPGGRLTVDTEVGAITVHAGSTDRVEVTVTREGRGNDDLKLSFEQDGKDVTVRGELPGWFHMSWSGKVEFDVTVPQSFDLDLETSGGEIAVFGVHGGVEARTSGGGLHFEEVVGKVDGRTSGGGVVVRSVLGDVTVGSSGGPIEVHGVRGSIEAKTSGGGVSMEDVGGSVVARSSGGPITLLEVGGPVDAHTSGGGIEVSLTRSPGGESKLSTSGGGITLRVPADAAFDLDARTSGGRVTSDLPVTVRGSVKEGSLQGPVNGGGPTVTLRSSGGGIRILRR